MEMMLEGGYNLGGEQSGHIIFLDHNTTGDGLVTAMQILAIMRQDGRTLSDLAGCFTSYPQVLVNVRVREKRDLAEFPEISARIDEIEQAMNGSGRLLIRYSGTELKLRIMLEGEDETVIQGYADELAAAVKARLG
jgi:phosphoglucosamine mutase